MCIRDSTNILRLMGETAIYDTKGKIGVAIFILWTVFIAVKYYLYVLFSEFTSDNGGVRYLYDRNTFSY